MATPYVRPKIGGWLAPVILGPFVASYAAVSLYAAFGPIPDPIPRIVVWGILMAAATVWSSVYALLQSFVDVALLALRVRTFQNGGRAWGSAVVAPAFPLVTYMVYSPHKWVPFGPWVVAGAILLPMIVSMIAVRIVWGKKPG